MKVIVTTAVLFLACYYQAGSEKKQYTFQKEGFVEEYDSLNKCIAKGQYNGGIRIDTVMWIDPETLFEKLYIGIGNVKTGEWRYYSTTGAHLATINYGEWGELYSPNFFTRDTIKRAYDSSYYVTVY